MISKENSVYLFIGQDNSSKEAQLKLLKRDFSSGGLDEFNCDVLYGRGLSLNSLQEKLLCLPVKAKKRILVIRQAQELTENIQEFILEYVKKPAPGIVLVIDIESLERNNRFAEHLAKFSRLYRFKEPVRLDTFALGRQIESRRPDLALKMLNQLLYNGEKPERILGGLRYILERDAIEPIKARKRLRLMLNCDIYIKTGKLKPNFALEKLIVRLCAF